MQVKQIIIFSQIQKNIEEGNVSCDEIIMGYSSYKIKEGDTLGGIAKKFHVSVKQLKAWNGLKSDNIRAGKTLKIGR